MKNIGLFGASMLEWGGGVDLLKNITNALHYGEEEYKLFLFIPVPGNDFKSKAKIFVKEKLLRKNAFHGIDLNIISAYQAEYPYVEIIYFTNSKAELEKKLKEYIISLLFPCAYSLGNDFSVPWVAYLPDFQHKYFPELFTADEIESRDKTFDKRINDSNAFLVTSETAKNDIRKFFPDCDKPVYVIPFSPAPRASWLCEDQNVLGNYDLPENCRYFIISNQFWIHKDHFCAFKALAELKKLPGCQDIHLLCTGEVRDYRNPNYGEELNQLIRSLDLTDCIHFLGYISKSDQIELMKGAIAVIQPTRYEGSPGGGEIEDAVALGQQSVVSDIPVNKEIQDDSVLFFEVGNEMSLAEQMKQSIERKWIRPQNKELIERGKQRQKVYYLVLKKMIEEMS